MRARRIGLSAVATVAVAAANSAELTELPPPTGAGVERGVATVRCETSSGVFATSRATVLDARAAVRADVLLTTAHGLPSTPDEVRRACRIVARGKEHPIEDVWRAGSHAAGPEHDWAVLVTTRIKGDLKRWRTAEADGGWLDQLVADRARVRLMLRFAGAAQTDCRLEAWTAQRLLAHTCVTYPGSSGSPLVVGVALEPVMIGLHVGSQLTWDGKKLDMVSVARPLDAAVIAAIEAASIQASQPPPKRRR